jgi:hypothetical protein
MRDTENIGAMNALAVRVTNNGAATITPVFSIIGGMSSTYPFCWKIENGPGSLEGGASAIYEIRAGIAEKAIPTGNVFIVRVNNALDDIFFVSEPAVANPQKQ